MTFTDVLPTLKASNRKDKIRAIQFLANEIAKEEESECNFFSLHNSGEAAKQLQKLIDHQKKNKLLK